MMEANKGPRPQTDSPPVFYSLALQPVVKFHWLTPWHSATLLAAAHLHTLCADGATARRWSEKKYIYIYLICGLPSGMFPFF